MSRLHSTLLALALGAVAAAGLFAAVQTVRLGQRVAATKPAVPARQLASRQAKLVRWSQSLRRERAKRPPELPKLPKFAPVAAPAVSAAPTAAVAAAPAPVKYVRPKPVVKYKRASQPATTTTTSQSPSDDQGETGDDSGQSDDPPSDDGGDG